jgi:hypothetical protein
MSKITALITRYLCGEQEKLCGRCAWRAPSGARRAVCQKMPVSLRLVDCAQQRGVDVVRPIPLT